MSTVTDVECTTDVGIDRPWVVIVWNDPINLMSYVTWVFQKLFGYSLEKATSLMLDVHEKGDRKSTRLNSSHVSESRMPSSA